MTTDRDAVIAEMFPQPIEAYVDELTIRERIPVVALGACLARYQEAGPLLRQLLARPTGEAFSTEGQATQLFRTLHIVGGARDPLAFPPLLRFLQGPTDDVDWVLGDAPAETLPKIVAGVFDGNAQALFEAILDRGLDGAIRGALLRAAAFLAWEQRIDRPRMIALLEQFAAEDSAPGDGLAWSDWSEAIALLGLRHLEPLVSEAEARERLEEGLFERSLFEEMLAKAEQAPDDKSRFEEANLGYIDDVLVALEVFPNGDEESEWDGEENFDDWAPSQPVINPWRHVGRNDPCPCGSGKKAKRCCLAA